MSAARCASVHYGTPTVPFAVGVPVRCTKAPGHAAEFHAGSGRDLDGEPFGAAWRELLALPAPVEVAG